MRIQKHPAIKNLFVSACGTQVWYETANLSKRGLKCPSQATRYPACHLHVSIQKDKYGYAYLALPSSVSRLNNLGKIDKKGNFRPIKKKVHQLVAQAFCNNPESFKYVDHLNSNPLDNRCENLQWVSKAQNNSIDFEEKGFYKIVDKYPDTLKLKALDLIINKGYSIREVSRITSIKTNTLSEAKRGDTWLKVWNRFNDQSKDVDSSESKRGTSKDEDMV